MSDRSPQYFGIRLDYLLFIPPLIYFLSKTLEGLWIAYCPLSTLSQLGDSDTCTLTEHSERLSISNDRRQSDKVQAVLAFIFANLVSFVLRHEAKWNASSPKGRLAYKLEYFEDRNVPPKTRIPAPIMVASHDDYRMVLHSEAMRLLCFVALSVGLCPMAEYFFCTREMVSERLYSRLQESTHGGFSNGLFMIYLVLRYGTLPCFLIALFILPSMLINTSLDEHLHHMAIYIWDTWIEVWIKAHEKENKAKEDWYMALDKDYESWPFGSGVAFDHFPGLMPDTSWREKYEGFGSQSVRN